MSTHLARREAVATIRQPTSRQRARRQRERQTELLLVGGIAAVIVVVIALLGIGIYREAIARYQDTIATVDDRTFTVGDYIDYMKYRDYLLDQQSAQLASFGGQAQQLQSQLQMQRSILPMQAIEDLLETEVVNRAATQLGITVSDADMAKALEDRFVEPVKEGETPDVAARDQQVRQNFDRVVAESGLSAEYLRQMIRDEVIRQKVEDQVGAQVPTTQEQVKLRAIVLKDEETATQALARVQSGEDFEAVAKDMTTDTAGKENGGDFGWLVRGTKDQSLEVAAFALQPGQVVTEPVQSASAFYVLKAEDRQDREVAASDLSTLKAKAFQDFVEQQKQGFTISRYVTSEKQLWAQDRVAKAREQRLKKAS